jgi:short-chain Z-isoprenyl diphosphate synthase
MLRLLYWLYESRLRRQICRRPVPRHVGIILDGNRRYARKQGFADPRAAYDLGAEKLDDVLAWCSDLAIPGVTLWVCSIDNLKRPQTEVAGILAAVEAKISALAEDPAIHRRRVRVKAVGRLDLLPPSTVAVLRKAEQATANHDALTLTIAIAYGGGEEIADAVRDFVRDKVRQGANLDAIVEEITPSAIDNHLYRGAPGSRPYHPHKRRDPFVGLPALAERSQRVLFLRRELARVPQGRFSPRHPIVSGAFAAFRAIKTGSGPPRLFQPKGTLSVQAPRDGSTGVALALLRQFHYNLGRGCAALASPHLQSAASAGTQTDRPMAPAEGHGRRLSAKWRLPAPQDRRSLPPAEDAGKRHRRNGR